MPFRLQIITPDRTVLDAPADFVAVRGVEGELGVLPGHIPFFTKLRTDLATVHLGEKREIVAVMGGFLDVHPDRVTILADAAERASEIDHLRAVQAKERSEVEAARVKDAKNTAALERAVVRLRAVELLERLPQNLRVPPSLPR